jgi:hypothetical protein
VTLTPWAASLLAPRTSRGARGVSKLTAHKPAKILEAR